MWGRFKALLGSVRRSNGSIGAEKALWLKLRGLKDLGFSFKRQVHLMSYVVDFVEHEARLVIAIENGPSAGNGGNKGNPVRDKVLTEEGYRVLRFQPEDILMDVNGVTEFIVTELLLKSKAKRRLPAASGTA